MLNRRELAIFVALYLYMVNMSTANDMRRVIILASLIQIHALRAQLLILNQRRIQRRSRHKIAIIPCWHGRLILPKEISGPKTILLGRIFIPMNVAKTSSSIETVHLYRCVRMKFYPEIFSIACTFDGRVCHKINRKAQMSTKSPAPRQDSGAFEEWPRKDKDGCVRPSRSHLACSAMTGF